MRIVFIHILACHPLFHDLLTNLGERAAASVGQNGIFVQLPLRLVERIDTLVLTDDVLHWGGPICKFE